MKKNTAINIGTAWLLFLLASATPQLVGITTVNANNATVVYTSFYYEMYENENDYSSDITYDIVLHMYYYMDYNYLLNCYGSCLTHNRVGSVADSCEDDHDYTAVFFKGHGQNTWCGTNLHYYLMDNDGDHITDYLIWGNTSQSEHDFVFLWACKTAHERGYWCNGCGKPYGMAYSWLWDSYQSPDGYDNPDSDDEVFLGWYMGSPGFTNSTGYSSYDYGNFAEKFYYYLLHDEQSVKEALDSASDDTLGENSFNDALIHADNDGIDVHGYTTWLYVYGNGNKGLPT